MTVRREKVVLDLDDKFSAGMARAAASTALLDKELNGLSGDGPRTSRSLADTERSVDRLGRTADRSGTSINQFSGRLGLAAKAATLLGPALGAATVPAIAGLTLGFGAAAGAAGTMVLALNGVGDALKALDAYQLDPTAANLKKLHQTMSNLSPAARDFVHELDDLEPRLRKLRDTAAAGFLPGLTEGIDSLLKQFPLVRSIISELATTSGDLAAETGKALNGPEWTAFLNMIRSDARPVLTDLGHTLGDVTTGLADLIVAVEPLGMSFSHGLRNAARDFRDFARGADDTESFQHFLDYVEQTGPEVLDTLGSVARTFGDVVAAAAPLGGPTLKALQALADVVDRIARSDLGTPLVALALGAGALQRVAGAAGAMKAVTGMSGLGGGIASKASPVPVFVTNLGAGGLGGAGAGAAAGAAARGAAGEAGVAGTLGAGLGSIGILGGAAIGGFGLADSLANAKRNKSMGELASYELIAAAGADKAAAATKRWQEQQAGLGQLLMGPALPTHLHNLKSLPPDVRTKVETPGAIQSAADIADLTRKYHLTPKQVRTVVEASGVDHASSAVRELGHYYGLTPKQVRTLITQAGMDSSQAEVRRLSALYHLTPKQVRTLITADAHSAEAAVARIKAQLASIPRSISTSYYVNQINSVSKAPLNFNPTHQAVGGSVPKDGGPYADRYPYLLAPGEEVISNRHGQADRHRGLLKAINAGRLAAGGTAGFGPWNINDPFQDTPGGSTSGWHGAVWPSSPWGPLHASTQELSVTLKDASKSLKAHTKDLDDDKTALSNLRSAAQQLRSSVAGQFTGTNFNAGSTSTDPATGMTSYVSDLQAQESTMFANRVSSDRFLSDLKALKKMGLSGAAFLQLAQSNDVTLLDQLVESGRSGVANYNQLLGAQSKSAHDLATYVGTAVYGSRIDAAQADVLRDRQVVKNLDSAVRELRQEIKRMGKHVHDGAKSGTHAGVTDKAKSTQHMVRNRPKGA